jgi:hypothetical protein
MYQLINDLNTNTLMCIKRLADETFIPLDSANTDYQEYLKWIEEGNTPLPPDDFNK